jgi:hypothetical protein
MSLDRRILLTSARASMGEELVLDFALHEVSRCGVRLRLAPKVFATAAALLCARVPVSPREMAEYLYDAEDGGPELALATVRVWVMQARRGLRVFGLGVETGPFGWQVGSRGGNGSGCTRSTWRRKGGSASGGR